MKDGYKKRSSNFCVLVVAFSIASVFAYESNPSDVLEVSVDVKQPIICLEVEDDSLYLGEVTLGYHVTDNTTIQNCGNVRISLSAIISDGSDSLFEYLKLNANKDCTGGGWSSLEYFWQIFARTLSYGGTDGQITDLCARLDLTEYEGAI